MTEQDAALVASLLLHRTWRTGDGDISDAPHLAAARIESLSAEVERLRAALTAYTEYCPICHGRGSIIEEDSVTGADLWRDCPGCTNARAALEASPAEILKGARVG
jgi:hypothetical protein